MISKSKYFWRHIGYCDPDSCCLKASAMSSVESDMMLGKMPECVSIVTHSQSMLPGGF